MEVLLQDYISKNAITVKELSDGRYAELENIIGRHWLRRKDCWMSSQSAGEGH